MNKRFITMLEEIGISLNATQLHQFEIYYDELIMWNTKLNLTSITEKYEVYLKHFFDSACLVRAIPISNQSLLDVGSGAGFPSIPLKILFPELQVTIIDALQKRITFLEQLTDKLGVDITLVHGRAEEYQNRESFDIVTARAVANLQILSELCIPFVAIGGYFLAMKGPHYQEELDVSMHAFEVLHAELDSVVTYPIDHLDRSIVKIIKRSETPSKYPRRYKKIKSKPL